MVTILECAAMDERVKVRRTLKWLGVGTCAVFLVFAVASTWCGFSYRSGSFGVGVDGGRVWSMTLDGKPSDVQKVGGSWAIAKGWDYHFGIWQTRGLFSWIRTGRYESKRTPLIDRALGMRDNGLQGTVITTWYSLPLWIPLAVAGIPTLFLTWRDRRRPVPGRCVMCNYDLTGNVSGRCPECGTSCSVHSLRRVRVRELLRYVRPGVAASVFLLGAGLWFYSVAPATPRVIAAVGPNERSYYFVRLRNRKPTLLEQLSYTGHNCYWDGKWLFVTGTCRLCSRPSAKRYSFVLAKLPGGLAYATMDSSAPGHAHLTRPRYISVGILFLLAIASSILIMLSPRLLPHVRKLLAARL